MRCHIRLDKNGPFKGVVRIKAQVKSFSLKGKSNVVVSRKQYPLTAAHAITTHKSQGQTYQYMITEKHLSIVDRFILQ